MPTALRPHIRVKLSEAKRRPGADEPPTDFYDDPNLTILWSSANNGDGPGVLTILEGSEGDGTSHITFYLPDEWQRLTITAEPVEVDEEGDPIQEGPPYIDPAPQWLGRDRP